MRHEKEALTAESGQDLAAGEGLNTADNHARRIERYSRAKERATGMRAYLEARYGKAKCGITREEAKRAHRGLSECGEYLLFHHYYTLDEYRLVKAVFCKQHYICPLCAIRRAAKSMATYLPRFEYLQGTGFFQFWLVTLTVKDGPDLIERMDHLRKGLKALNQRRRDSKRKRAQASIWRLADGAVGAFEVTRGANSGEWHPHIHMVVATLEQPFPTVEVAPGKWRCKPFEREWLEITGDSSVVDVRPFGAMQTAEASFCEVFKYALKLSSLSFQDNWDASIRLKDEKMVFSFGCFRGLEPPEELTDDVPLEDLPYTSLLYRWVAGAGYSVDRVESYAPSP